MEKEHGPDFHLMHDQIWSFLFPERTCQVNSGRLSGN